MTKPRVLSGMRPTGKLHLGHLVGALDNWVSLQDDYECFYCIVDWHALTTHYDSTEGIRENIIDNAMDWLAAGIDPQRSTLFIQSHVMEHAELHLLFSMITPLPWLERVPSYKEQMVEIKDHDLRTYGFLGYPLLQSADILIYKANAVPVGGDQDICPVGDYHDVFSDKIRVAEVDQGCRTAGIGCVECKMWLFDSLQKRLGPLYERRRQLEAHPGDARDILSEGSKKAKIAAGQTMSEVREAMKI